MYTHTLEQEPQLHLAEPEPQFFDLLASVDMARFDLQRYGFVGSETKNRILDEELTLIVEGVDRPHRTTFALKNIDGELMYFEKGAWRPYVASLCKGLQVSEELASSDARYAFLALKAADELREGYAMQNLQVGQSMVVCRRYPIDVEQLYGKKLLSDVGYQPNRKLGFISVATRLVSGDVVLTSQTVDNSNDEAFWAVQLAAEGGNSDIDVLLNIYDEKLSEIIGHRCLAGRSPDSQHQDAWNMLLNSQDLIQYYYGEIQKLANSSLTRPELLEAKKRLTYGVWAAFKNRLDTSFEGSRQQPMQPVDYYHSQHDILNREVFEAFQKASAKGEVLLACGGSIGGIMDANASEVRDMIFGSKSEAGEDKFGSLIFKCPKGHTNTRPRNQLIDRCKTCGTSVKC